LVSIADEVRPGKQAPTFLDHDSSRSALENGEAQYASLRTFKPVTIGKPAIYRHGSPETAATVLGLARAGFA
jgi:hypothetical protein